MTALIQYELACAALAEATRIDQILPIHDEIQHVKLYAKQINNRELLIKASEFQMRVERKLGAVLAAAKEAGQIKEGRHKKNGATDEPFPVTLREIGVDKHLSARAQKRAELSDDLFETSVEDAKQRIASQGARIIDGEGPIDGARSIMSDRKESSKSLDYFPTPPWATRALMERVLPHLGVELPLHLVWEPACGEGHMAVPLAEYADKVVATDIHDYGFGRIQDFLNTGADHPISEWIITNPPFKKRAMQFVERALALADNVAMFFRSQWVVEGIERYEQIFRDHPPTLCAFFVERVNLCKGRWEPYGSTATAYSWLIWMKDRAPQAPFWIPPGCRETYMRDSDIKRFGNNESQSGDALTPTSASSAPASSSPSPLSLNDAGAPLLKGESDGERIPGQS